MTSVEDVSVEITGLSVLISVMSPQITRPPCFGCPAAGALVGAGAAGLPAVVGCAAAAGALVAAGAVVAPGADGGAGACAGPHAATSSVLAVRVDTIRPQMAAREKFMERFSLRRAPDV